MASEGPQRKKSVDLVYEQGYRLAKFWLRGRRRATEHNKKGEILSFRVRVNPLSCAPDYCLSRAELKYRSRAFFTFLNGSGFSLSGILISDESQASALSSFIGHIGFLQS